MTPKERAAMQQALEFLESGDFVYPSNIATALREALDHSGKSDEMVIGWDRVKPEAIASDPLYQQGFVDGVEEGRNQVAEQAEQEPVACNCGTNPWHDCNESEGCRIKKTLGISSRPVYDQRADHHKMMLGYEIATKYGVFENKAFQLCDEMKKLYAAPVRTKDLTDDEIFAFDNKAEIEPLAFARAVIAAYKEKNK